MNEKEKAQKKFATLMEKTIATARTALDRKITKAMNAVDSNGNVYTTEAEIMDAYAYEDITDNERRRLLEALEYRENRSHYFMEDYLISLCRRGLRLIDDDNYSDAKERKEREIRNAIAEVHRNGGTALTCGCCGVVIGEVSRDGKRHEYPEYTKCVRRRACKDCLRNCRKQCNDGED